jgi:ribonuclease P protein component
VKTIKSSTEISYLFGHGQRVNTPHVSLIVLKHEDEHDHNGRVAFIAGKKLGNAVWRNRAKRRMRSLCHSNGGPFEGYDVVVLARRTTNDVSFGELNDSFGKALKKAGIVFG